MNNEIVKAKTNDDLVALGYSLAPSRSKPGKFRWWLDTNSDGVSVPFRDCSEQSFITENDAWADARRDALASGSLAEVHREVAHRYSVGTQVVEHSGHILGRLTNVTLAGGLFWGIVGDNYEVDLSRSAEILDLTGNDRAQNPLLDASYLRIERDAQCKLLTDAKVKQAGYAVHQGKTVDGPDLDGRWWWTLGAMGSASYETSHDEFDTEAEAWADAIRDQAAHEATYLFPSLPDADSAEVALIAAGFDVHRSVTCHCTLLSIAASDEEADAICTANNGTRHEEDDEAGDEEDASPSA